MTLLVYITELLERLHDYLGLNLLDKKLAPTDEEHGL